MCRQISRRAALTTGAAALLAGVPFTRSAALAAPPGGEDAAAPQSLPKPPPSSAEQTVTQEDVRLSDLLRRGATMEEVAQARGGSPVKTPQDALRLLKVGNARFFSGQGSKDELSAQERRAQVLGQSPFAVILGCSDSRVPTEIVYDQTLGDLFAVRVAGNVAEPATVASIQYAVTHLKSRLIVVMGHEGCGAVKAAMHTAAERQGEPKPVQGLLDMIVPAVDHLPKIRDRKAKEREAVVANIRLQSYALSLDPVLKGLIAKNEVGIVGAFYEITSGIVDFYETPDELIVEKEVAQAAGLPVPPGAPSVHAPSKVARK
ncbi:MAG TPA: carbonic anhydrase [Armatimonadaceae bacterium]|nr:carbonic anhydrase [Armatimonadaceae bacterium]